MERWASRVAKKRQGDRAGGCVKKKKKKSRGGGGGDNSKGPNANDILL